MKIVLTELYIILVYEKFYFFIYLIIHGSIVVLYDCTFEICFVYERKCGDMIFCNLNFLRKYLTLVSSALSTGIIVDIYIPWWRM